MGWKGQDGSMRKMGEMGQIYVGVGRLEFVAAGLMQNEDGGREKLRVEMVRKSEESDGGIEMKEKEEKK